MSTPTLLLMLTLAAPQGGVLAPAQGDGLAPGSGASAPVTPGVFTEWNLISRNDVTSLSEVDGSVLIGGDLNGSSNCSVQSVTAANGDGLMMVGGLGGSISVNINNGGHIEAGGNFVTRANLNGGGLILPGYPKLIQAYIDDAFKEAYVLQAYCMGLPTNGVVDNAGNMVATSTVVGGENVAVYAIDQATIAGRGHLNLVMGNADSVVINFDGAGSGGRADFNAPPNLVGDFNAENSSRIIWNFINTTQVYVNNSFSGMLLAPDADLVLAGGGINGTVVVDGVSSMTAEIRGNTIESGFFMACSFPPTYSVFGNGCLGSSGVPTLSISQPARIGQMFELSFSSVPTNKTGYLFIGASKTSWNGLPLPFYLPWQPKCALLVSGHCVIPFKTGSSTSMKWGFPVPNNPAILGGNFYNQAMFMDRVFFLPRTCMTNAGHGVIGCR